MKISRWTHALLFLLPATIWIVQLIMSYVYSAHFCQPENVWILRLISGVAFITCFLVFFKCGQIRRCSNTIRAEDRFLVETSRGLALMFTVAVLFLELVNVFGWRCV